MGWRRPSPRTGFALGRLKTGTPPRLDGRTIDWAGLEVQQGDDPPPPFSFLTERITTPQVPCHITATTAATHALIRANLRRAPIYSGRDHGGRPALLPVDRGQGGALCRPRAAPDLSRARRAGRRHGLSQRHLDLAAARRCRRRCCDDPRPRARARCSGRAMRSSTITSIRASCIRPWKPAASRALFSPARSTAPPAMRRRRPKG